MHLNPAPERAGWGHLVMDMHFAAPGAQTKTLARGLPYDAMPAQTDPQIAPEQRTLEIVESAYEPTPCGKGMVLRCLTQEVGGGSLGRLTYLDFILEHDDERMQEGGQRDFAGLRRATGVLSPKDTAELHWRPFVVRIGIKARKDTGELENVVKEYLFDAALEAA